MTKNGFIAREKRNDSMSYGFFKWNIPEFHDIKYLTHGNVTYTSMQRWLMDTQLI